MRRAIPGIAAVTAGLLLLAGCTALGAPQSAPQGGSAPSTDGVGPITFAIGQDDTNWLAPVIARWNGLYPKQRVTLLLLP